MRRPHMGRRMKLVTLRPSHAVLHAGACPVGAPLHRPWRLGRCWCGLTVRALSGKVKYPSQVIPGMLCFTLFSRVRIQGFTPSGEDAPGGWRLE